MRTSEELAAIASFCASHTDEVTPDFGYATTAERDLAFKEEYIGSTRRDWLRAREHPYSRDFAGLPSEASSEPSSAMSTYEKFEMEASGMSIEALKVAKAIFNKDIYAVECRMIDEPRSIREMSDNTLEVTFKGSPRELQELVRILRDYR